MLKDHSSVLSDTRKSDEELASSNISGASGNNVEILLSEIRPASLIPMPESPTDPSENSTSGMKMPVDDPRAEETGTKTKSNMTSSTESEDEEEVYQCLVRPIGNDYSRLNRFSNKKGKNASKWCLENLKKWNSPQIFRLSTFRGRPVREDCPTWQPRAFDLQTLRRWRREKIRRKRIHFQDWFQSSTQEFLRVGQDRQDQSNCLRQTTRSIGR